MNTQQHPASQLQNLALQPIAVWFSSFDYIFGFQIKLVQDYWGIGEDGKH